MSNFNKKSKCYRNSDEFERQYFGGSNLDLKNYSYDNHFPEFQDRNNNNYCRKKLKSKRPRSSLKYRQNCGNQRHLVIRQSESKKIDFHPSWHNSAAVDLCEPLQNLCLSPTVFKAYNKLHIHDKKILNRMAQKRNEKAILNENAWLAHKYWENEYYEREMHKLEQQLEHKNTYEKKRERDRCETLHRLEELARRKQEELEKKRQEIQIKDTQLNHRLKNLEWQREMEHYRRRQDELRRIETLELAQNEQKLDDEVRKREIYHHLEHRLTRADTIRKKHMHAYQQRLHTDNLTAKAIHAENYQDVNYFEGMKHEELLKNIRQKNQKANRFQEQRRQNLSDTIERAKLSASLRDLVRRSVSPEGFQYSSGGSWRFYDRPISNLSFQSSIKLG